MSLDSQVVYRNLPILKDLPEMKSSKKDSNKTISIYNYRELNVLDYAVHIARRCSTTVSEPRKAWLLYLAVMEDLLSTI